MFEKYTETVRLLNRRVERMNAALGLLLNRKLHEHEWAVEDLALRSGVKVGTIYKLLAGQRENPKAETITRLAAGFDQALSEFVREWEQEAEALPESKALADMSPSIRDNANRKNISPLTLSLASV